MDKTPQQYIISYRDRIKADKGLTAKEWDHFNALEKCFDRTAYDKRRAEDSKNYNIKCAMKLSTDDLLNVLIEKEDLSEILKQILKGYVGYDNKG